MIIENPYTQPHYLTSYWCIKPSMIDKNRRMDGDYFEKPTQYWFINCEVQNNLDFEPIEFVPKKVISKVKKGEYSVQTQRSMIHPQYARRFIKQYVLKEKQMTNKELIKDMLERQKAYDEEVSKKHNVDYVSKSQLESALFDELGELMHAQKSDWCWWKFTQEPKDEAKVFEEYIDVVHFALMYEIKFGSGCYQDEDIKWNYNKLKTDLGFGQAYAFSCVISLTRDDNVLAYVIALGMHLGYSIEEIYNEYIRKNEINKERLKEGY